MSKCGASYIFAATGAIESRLMIKLNKTLIPFSKQMILNCLPEDKSVRADKCQGGTEAEVFNYAMKQGLIYESAEESIYTA